MFAWFLISATLLTRAPSAYKDTIGYASRPECEKHAAERLDLVALVVEACKDLSIIEGRLRG